jgi:hypothetical protein
LGNLPMRSSVSTDCATSQIEFVIRDAKQRVGLTHCQARSEGKSTFIRT